MEQQELSEVVKILGSKKQTHSDVKFLFDRYRHIGFLKELMDQNKKPIVFDLLASLRCHVVNKHDVVFYTGERSAKFYLIIQGQVKVLMSEAKPELTECPIPGLYEKQMSDKRLFPNRENR